MSRKRAYRSYLLRCWDSDERDAAGAPVERFVVERITDPHQRWVFGSFGDLVDFLRGELLEQPGPGGHDEAPGQQPG